MFLYSWGFFAPKKINVYTICLEDCFVFGITCMFRCWARNVFLCGGGRGGDTFFPPNTWATVGLGLWYLPLLHAGWTPPLEKPAGRGLCGSSWAEGHWIMVPWWWWHWRGIYPNHCKSTSPWLQIVVTCSDYDMFVFICIIGGCPNTLGKSSSLFHGTFMNLHGLHCEPVLRQEPTHDYEYIIYVLNRTSHH